MSLSHRLLSVLQFLAINPPNPENRGYVAFKGQQPMRSLFAGGQSQSAAPERHASAPVFMIAAAPTEAIKFG